MNGHWKSFPYLITTRYIARAPPFHSYSYWGSGRSNNLRLYMEWMVGPMNVTFFRKKSQCRGNEVKDLEMRSSSIIQISVLIKVRLRRRTWMKKEEAMWLRRQRVECWGHKSRGADSPQKPEEAESEFSSRVPRGSRALLCLELLAFKVEVRV